MTSGYYNTERIKIEEEKIKNGQLQKELRMYRNF